MKQPKNDERCPTCGRQVPPDSGIREAYEGIRYAFCEPKCQALLECDPERYLGETQLLGAAPGYS